MEIKTANPKMRQDQIDKELGCSSSLLQGYGQDIIMLSPDRIPSNSKKEGKRTQTQASIITNNVTITSKNLKLPQMRTLPLTTQRIRKAN